MPLCTCFVIRLCVSHAAKTYSVEIMRHHRAKAPLCPSEVYKICAIGWPIGPFKILSRLVPMQKARETFIPG